MCKSWFWFLFLLHIQLNNLTNMCTRSTLRRLNFQMIIKLLCALVEHGGGSKISSSQWRETESTVSYTVIGRNFEPLLRKYCLLYFYSLVCKFLSCNLYQFLNFIIFIMFFFRENVFNISFQPFIVANVH